ncbi:MAG TPA: hypothetical protein VFJ16_20920 [Longimicrobium sp.]|nr:hypothetical protein [Longimicrobium sp.]
MQQYAEQYRNDPEFQKKADEIMAQVLVRSSTDAEFRNKLVSDPAQALADFTGTDRKNFEHLNIAFVESKAAATIVLPDAVDASAELSESELEAVAGGSEPVTILAIAGVAAACLGALVAGMTLS